MAPQEYNFCPMYLGREFFCYGNEENTRVYTVYLTTANQSEICVAYLALCLFWRRAYRVWKMNRQIMVEFFIMNETMIFAQKSDEKRQL